MARSLLTGPFTQNIGNDDGLHRYSISSSETINFPFMTTGADYSDLTNFTITASAFEGVNINGAVPTEQRMGATAIPLTVLGKGSDNTFQVRMQASALLDMVSTAPSVGKPIYFFLSVGIADSTGANPQSAEAVRGMIEIVFSHQGA